MRDQKGGRRNDGITIGKHRLTIRVDNRSIVDIGVNSHSISDHTQGNWNGIVGDISLQATAPVWIQELQVYPHFKSSSLTFSGKIGNLTGREGSGTLNVKIQETTGEQRRPAKPLLLTEFKLNWQPQGADFQFELPIQNPKEWNEFQPNTYNVTLRLGEGDDLKIVSFGFRDLTTEGTQFAINGHKLFLRGTLECCIFPKTGHPPTDLGSWRRIIRRAEALY